MFVEPNEIEDLRGKGVRVSEYPEGEPGNYANFTFIDPRLVPLGIRMIA